MTRVEGEASIKVFKTPRRVDHAEELENLFQLIRDLLDQLGEEPSDRDDWATNPLAFIVRDLRWTIEELSQRVRSLL